MDELTWIRKLANEPATDETIAELQAWLVANNDKRAEKLTDVKIEKEEFQVLSNPWRTGCFSVGAFGSYEEPKPPDDWQPRYVTKAVYSIKMNGETLEVEDFDSYGDSCTIDSFDDETEARETLGEELSNWLLKGFVE